LFLLAKTAVWVVTALRVISQEWPLLDVVLPSLRPNIGTLLLRCSGMAFVNATFGDQRWRNPLAYVKATVFH
jgi:hypothetical protein